MHVMKECPNLYNVAFSLSKNSIYKHQFDKKIIQLVESGLTQHYLDIENDKLAKLEKSSVAIHNQLICLKPARKRPLV